MKRKTLQVEKELYIVMNEDREMESGPTLEQASARLDQNYSSNIVWAAKVIVHMKPAKVVDAGCISVNAGKVARLKVKGP